MEIGNWASGRFSSFANSIDITRGPEEYFPKHLTNWRTYAIIVIRDQCGTGGIGRRA